MLIETPFAVGTISSDPWVIVQVRMSTKSLPLYSRIPTLTSWNLFFLKVKTVLSTHVTPLPPLPTSIMKRPTHIAAMLIPFIGPVPGHNQSPVWSMASAG